MRKTHFGLILLCLALTGCTPRFLNPMLSKETILAQPALIGSWECEAPGKGEPRSMTASAFAALAKDGWPELYALDIVFNPPDAIGGKAPARRGHFIAGFIRLGDHLFANITSHPNPPSDGNDPAPTISVSAFIIARVTLDGDTLTYSELSDSWMDELLKKDDHALEHVHQDMGGILFTASGEKVRAFVAAHAADPAAWHKAKVWKRIAPAK